jgi:hypothetical protein
MIYLDTEMHERLRRMALDEHVSMAELIRRAVAKVYGGKRPARKAVRK